MYSLVVASRVIILIYLAYAFVGCNDSGDNSIPGKNTKNQDMTEKFFDKLIGTWQNKDGKNFERWTKNKDGNYGAVGFSLNNGDTSWNEEANIYREKDKWVFENKVKGQNDGKAIKFTSLFVLENSVHFNNPAHDFPTDINYKLSDDNTLNAFIAGPNNKGGKDTLPFHFKRLN